MICPWGESEHSLSSGSCYRKEELGMAFSKYLTLFAILLLCSPAVLCAHEIHLKNGSVIKADQIERSGSKLTCYRFGGSFSVDLSTVDKIVYGPVPQSPASPQLSELSEETAPQVEERSLAKSLEERLQPKSLVERANLAVVSIATSAGFGSGFFISSDGFIVTNRHVVRGSPKNDRKVEAAIDESEQKLEQWRKKLGVEKQRLEAFDKKLAKNREELQNAIKREKRRLDPDRVAEARQSIQERSRYLREWRADYKSRYRKYRDAESEFKNKRDDFRKKNRKLSSQSRFAITLADGSEESAILYKISDRLDLALLRLNGFVTPCLEAADITQTALGQSVYAIGSPLRLKNSVTSGVVSNFRDPYVQTNAEIYPGNSGGPLVTEQGRVLGVNTMKMITEKFEGLGFAISIANVQKEFGNYFQDRGASWCH